MTRLLRLLIGVIAVGLVVSGCSFHGAYDLPLPGGADLGSHPITVEAEFGDVLDLVPHSSVKVDNVDVGQVSAIHLVDDGRAARVTMRIRGGLALSSDSTARIEQTSLLGEKYVALTTGRASTPLKDGAELGPGRARSDLQSGDQASIVVVQGGIHRQHSHFRPLSSCMAAIVTLSLAWNGPRPLDLSFERSHRALTGPGAQSAGCHAHLAGGALPAPARPPGAEP